MENKYRLRIRYAVWFILLVVIEVIIAVYVHDGFIRPYLGDMLVVIVLYCLVRVIVPLGLRLLPLYVFLFAVFVECLQYFDLAARLGLAGHPVLRTLTGSVFDVVDIVCYAAGCLLIAGASAARARILRYSKASGRGGDTVPAENVQEKF